MIKKHTLLYHCKNHDRIVWKGEILKKLSVNIIAFIEVN